MTERKAADPAHIWDAVCKTNPKNTKQVNQRGGFTAVCAYSQIETATRLWGPVGEGWGWFDVVYELHADSGVLLFSAMFWQGKRENALQINTAVTFAGEKRYDTDAHKKALTDALTKWLSYLGFNADVFLGRFDDNKYVAKMREEFQEPIIEGDNTEHTPPPAVTPGAPVVEVPGEPTDKQWAALDAELKHIGKTRAWWAKDSGFTDWGDVTNHVVEMATDEMRDKRVADTVRPAVNPADAKGQGEIDGT